MIRLIQIAFLLAIVIPFGMAVRASAQFYTGNDLYARCSDDRQVVTGYVMGIYDGSKVTEFFDLDETMKVCLPAGVVSGQLSDVACKYLSDNPGKRHSQASWLVFEALQGSFPCQKKMP